MYECDLYWTQTSTGYRPKTKICWLLIVIEITRVEKLHCWCIFVNFPFFPLFSHKNIIKHFSFSHAKLSLKKVVRIFCDLYWTSIKYTSCMALPKVKLLSNPRRMHSREEGEEKEEQGLPRAPSCCSTTFPAPFPLPPHTRRAPTGLPGTRYQDTSPPLPPHCKQASF